MGAIVDAVHSLYLLYVFYTKNLYKIGLNSLLLLYQQKISTKTLFVNIILYQKYLKLYCIQYFLNIGSILYLEGSVLTQY